MKYFAKLDTNNIVISVMIVADENAPGDTWQEQEISGIEFCQNEFGAGRYLITSRDNEYRIRYAGIDMVYDETLDGFIHQKPFDSWVLNDEFYWEAPVVRPSEPGMWVWDNETNAWVASV